MKKILNKISGVLNRHRWLYYTLNYSWGILTTLVGFIVLLCVLRNGKIYKGNKWKGFIIFEFNRQTSWGFSIGTVIFVGKDDAVYDNYTTSHEIGHSFQNAIFGPFMLFAVLIPSFVRYHYRELTRHPLTTEYDDIWFEGSATEIGRLIQLENFKERGKNK